MNAALKKNWIAKRDESNRLTLKVNVESIEELENILKRLPEKSLKFENASSTELFFNAIKTARRNCLDMKLNQESGDSKSDKFEKIEKYLDTLDAAYGKIKDIAALVNKSNFKDNDVLDLKSKLEAYQKELILKLNELINDKTSPPSKNILIELNRLKTASGEIDVYIKSLENFKSPSADVLKKIFSAKTSISDVQSLGDFISLQLLHASRISERVTGILNQEEFYDRFQKNEITSAFIESSTEIDIKANVAFAIQSTSAFEKDPYPQRDKKIQEAIEAMKANKSTPFSYELDLTPFIDNSADQRTLNKLICCVEGKSSAIEKDKNFFKRFARDIFVITGSIAAYGADLAIAAPLAAIELTATILVAFAIKPVLFAFNQDNDQIDKAITNFTKTIVDVLEKNSPLASFKKFLNEKIYDCAAKDSPHQKLLSACVDNHSALMTALQILSPGRLSTAIFPFFSQNITLGTSTQSETKKNLSKTSLEDLTKNYETYLAHKIFAEKIRLINEKMKADDKLTLALPREDLKAENFHAVSKIFGEIPFLFCNRLVMESLHAHPAPATAFLMLSLATGAGAILPVPLLLAKLGVPHPAANAIAQIDKALQVLPHGIASSVSGMNLASNPSLINSTMAVAFENKLLNLSVMALMEMMKSDSTLSARFAQNSETIISAAALMYGLGIGCASLPEIPMNLIPSSLLQGLPINTPINMPIEFANGLISTAKEAFVHGVQGANGLELTILGFKIACMAHESMQTSGSVFEKVPKAEWEAFYSQISESLEAGKGIEGFESAIDNALNTDNFPNLKRHAHEVKNIIFAIFAKFDDSLLKSTYLIGKSATSTEEPNNKIIKLQKLISMLSDNDIVCPFEPKNTKEGRELYNIIAGEFAGIKKDFTSDDMIKHGLNIDIDSYLTAFRNKYCEDRQNTFVRFVTSPLRIPYNIIAKSLSLAPKSEVDYYIRDSRTASLNRDLAGILNLFVPGTKIMIGTMGQAFDYSLRGTLGIPIMFYSLFDKKGADNMARFLQRNIGFSSLSQRLHEASMSLSGTSTKSFFSWLLKRETFIDRFMARVNARASNYADPKAIGASVSEETFDSHKKKLSENQLAYNTATQTRAHEKNSNAAVSNHIVTEKVTVQPHSILKKENGKVKPKKSVRFNNNTVVDFKKESSEDNISYQMFLKNINHFGILFDEIGDIDNNNENVVIRLKQNNNMIIDALKSMGNVEVHGLAITIQRHVLSNRNFFDDFLKKIAPDQCKSEEWENKNIMDKISAIKQMLKPSPKTDLTSNFSPR